MFDSVPKTLKCLCFSLKKFLYDDFNITVFSVNDWTNEGDIKNLVVTLKETWQINV